MILLWHELNKLARQGLRLLAGLLFVLAVLNVGVGGVALVDASPLDSSGKAGNRVGNSLLHLQLFGLIHIHESIFEEHMHALSPPPGVVEYDTTYQPPSQVLFISANALAGSGPTFSIHSADYGSGSIQNLISEFLPVASHELSLAGVTSRLIHADHKRQIDPFLPVPEKPPTFSTSYL
ncbi:MAG: hypothetical protein J0I20_30055 [Chloroflexi bacterium]|nr:hypothetical protein [Chloroflexota bacterium]OJV99076.1 MAG: hypothetical protein BGO39_16575 [Chloroflexi bacterium 54-19]